MAKKEPINVNLLMSDAKLIGGDGIEITTNENNDLIIGLSGAGSRLIKYERSDIEYGKDGDDYTWEDNILTCIHNLGIQLPLVMVYVTPKNGTAEETQTLEQAIIPHSYIRGDLNRIKFDFDGFQDYYITIKLLA